MTPQNTIDEIFTEDPSTFASRYLDYVGKLINQIDAKAVGKFVEVLLDARRRNAQIFFIGNGGSAATATHFANDLGVGTKAKKQPFRVISLTDNTAILTAIGNDFGYEEIFSRQLEYLAQPGDVLVAISASGNSPNLLKALNVAEKKEMITIGLTGFDGGELKKRVKHAVHVPTRKGEYGPVEDAHMVMDHLVGAYLIKLLQKEG